MATRTAANTDVDNGRLVVWSGLLNGDYGSPFSGYDWADASVAFTGTFGTGGSITLQGSNDGVNWFPLTDPQGNAITKTAAALEQISERTRFIRPIVTAGDGTTNLAATLWSGRSI